MIYSVFNSLPTVNLAINKASLLLRLPTLRTNASILIETLLSLFFHLIKSL